MQIEMVDINLVKEYERNPRQNDGAVDAVAASIEEFGFKVPVIVDKDNVLVAGHTRVRAARTLGLKEVPAIRAADLTPEQVRAFRLADNKLHELSSWDMQLLPLELKDLQAADFDLELHEWCFYGWKEGAAHKFFGPPNVSDLWHVKKVNPNQMVHLTEKPVELAVRAMQYSSLAGENVLDLFGGSGSTLIAAEQTGRRAHRMEIDPLYSDVIVQRWEQFTGRKAERDTGSAAGVGV